VNGLSYKSDLQIQGLVLSSKIQSETEVVAVVQELTSPNKTNELMIIFSGFISGLSQQI
jgi:hypothetical protein